eukprot:1926382-Prorocentrum_lima.AAC.1
MKRHMKLACPGMSQQRLLELSVGAGSQYALRLALASNAAVDKYNKLLKQVWEMLLERPFTWHPACIIFLTVRQSASLRRHAAYWA